MMISLKPCTVKKDICLEPKFGSDCILLIIYKDVNPPDLAVEWLMPGE